MTKLEKRNKYFFGLGTVGRDMFYAFESNALLYYLSNVLSLPESACFGGGQPGPYGAEDT